MNPLGHSEIQHAGDEPVETYGTVKLWGEADDAIQVAGDVEGCGAYDVTEGRFRLHGSSGSVVVELRFHADGAYWTWRSEADKWGTLPIAIGYEGNSTPVITVENVKQVTKI